MTLSAQQLEERRSGIGSSDIAAIADLDPHRDPVDVFLDKLGISRPFSSAATWIGDRLEEAVANLYAERVGAIMLKPSSSNVHADVEIARANVDRIAVVEGILEPRIVEIKNVGAFMAAEWGASGTADVPIDKMIQVQWQLEVCDRERADIAALIGGTDLRIYPILRDREFGAELLELGCTFWEEHVLTGIPPLHDAAAAKHLAALRYPQSSGEMLPATEEAERCRDRIRRAKRGVKRYEERLGQLEARAMDMIGDADGVEGCFTWKLDEAGAVAWRSVALEAKATDELIAKHRGTPARRFLLKEPKAPKKKGRRT